MRTAEIVSVNPEKAKEFLEKNNANRNLSKHKVSEYVRDMRHGDWNILTQISFDRDGNLLDGQHRLNAVVQSGETIDFIVVRGEDSNSVGYDRGKLRSIADTMAMNGMAKGIANNNAVGALRFILNEVYAKGHQATDSMIMEYAEEYEKEMTLALKLSCTATSKPLLKKAAAIASLYFALRCGVEEKTLLRFCEVVNTGMSQSDIEFSAVIVRNYILEGACLGYSNRMRLNSVMEQGIRDFSRGISRRRPYKTDVFVFREDIKEMDKEFIKSI